MLFNKCKLTKKITKTVVFLQKKRLMAQKLKIALKARKSICANRQSSNEGFPNADTCSNRSLSREQLTFGQGNQALVNQ
jgi:hypothetical protein